MARRKKLRVLYLLEFPLYGSGSGTYARYLAREVNKIAHTAILCPEERTLKSVPILPIKMPFKVAFTGHPEWPNCKLYQNISNLELYKIYRVFLERTIQVVEEFKPDIIHVHHAYPLSWAARFIEATYKIPFVITIHGSELPTAGKSRRYISMTIDALRRAKRIIPNSFYTKEWMLKIFGDNYRKQTRVIPGGVDITKFKKVVTDDIDRIYNLKGKRVVLFSGKLTPYKGVDYLVRAAKYIKGEVVILGQGSEMKKLKEIVKEHKLTNVQFFGHLGNKTNLLIKFYSRADVFVAPSVWDEPLGLVILEAMACETPVVVTRKGGIPLAVKEGKNGLFIRPRNSKDIAEKVNYLLENDERRMKMGRTAREIAVKRFSWELIAKQFANIYERFANPQTNGHKVPQQIQANNVPQK
jgi:glycosyltransferase involved in cell wall biosynthesis